MQAKGCCGSRKWSWVSWMCEPSIFFKKMDHSSFLLGCTGFFVALRGLSLVAAKRAILTVVSRASHHGGFSCCAVLF